MRKYLVDIPWYYMEKLFRPFLEKRALGKRRALYGRFVAPGELCFDVGANVGNRVEALLSLGARVVAVEPQEACCLELERRFGSRVEIVKKGLAEEEGIRTFYLSDATTISSFSKEFIDSVKDGRFKQHNWQQTEQVEMTTLDRLIQQYGLPAFIKIDVEGFELEVLKGLHQPVQAISYEYCVPEQLDKAVQCLEMIGGLGGKPECNYSVGESMEMALSAWVPVNEMIQVIRGKKFIDSSFGDIYVRQSAPL